MYTSAEVEKLLRQDSEHFIHPLHHSADHKHPILFVKGEKAELIDAQGKRYLDGLSSLWNVVVGHARTELADAAAKQMRTLEYATSYAGYTTIPAILLAEKIVELTYPSLTGVFFASGGSEANESAFKTARYFWKTQGKPDKVKIISRHQAYHGVTLAAMSATGLPAYHRMFAPLTPEFIQTVAAYPFRCELCGGLPCTQNHDYAAELERMILAEGADSVAAFIGEPVCGAGGVIPPPDGYWTKVRAICNKYDILLIADEVITGFGRTGKWFALTHWNVEPDIASFAKAVTSGYIPLGGILVSKRIQQAILDATLPDKYMHAYTYSGHATACAVGVRNLQLIEEEGLVERAAELGKHLLAGLATLRDLPAVGEVRGLGLIAGVELSEPGGRPFASKGQLGAKVLQAMLERGLYTRCIGDTILLAPPFVTTEAQLDRIIAIIRDSITVAVESVATPHA